MAHCCNPTPISPGPQGANTGNPQLRASCFSQLPNPRPGGSDLSDIPKWNIGDKRDRVVPQTPIKQPFVEPGGPTFKCGCVVGNPVENVTPLDPGGSAGSTTTTLCFLHVVTWEQECESMSPTEFQNLNNPQGPNYLGPNNSEAIKAMNEWWRQINGPPPGPNVQPGASKNFIGAGKECEDPKGCDDDLCPELTMSWIECFEVTGPGTGKPFEGGGGGGGGGEGRATLPPTTVARPPFTGGGGGDCECQVILGQSPTPICGPITGSSEFFMGGTRREEECYTCHMELNRTCNNVSVTGLPDPGLEHHKSVVGGGGLAPGGMGTTQGGSVQVSPGGNKCIPPTTISGPLTCAKQTCAPVTISWQECVTTDPGQGGQQQARYTPQSDIISQEALEEAAHPKFKQLATSRKSGNTPEDSIFIKSLAPRTFFPPANTPSTEGVDEEVVLKPVGLASSNNNTPKQRGIPPTREEEELIINPSMLVATDPANELYKKERVMEIPVADSILKFAHNKATVSRGVDPNNIFASTIPKWLADYLDTQGGKVFKAYNGTTIGANLFQTQVFENSLTPEVTQFLNQINNLNNTSLHLKTYIIEALKRSINKGTLSGYAPALFEQIINTSKTSFPTGTSTFSSYAAQKEAAYSLIRNKKISLDPESSSGDGDEQRIKQRYRIILSDEIKLSIPTTTLSGEKTYVSVPKEGLSVVTRSGTEVVPLQNEFLDVVTRKSSEKVAGASLRNIAYTYTVPTLNKIYGLLNNPEEGGVEGVNENYIELTAETPLSSEVEQDLTDTVSNPQLSLWAVDIDSITKLPPTKGYLKTHRVTYNMVWSSDGTIPGSNDVVFNNIIKEYSGPRMFFALPANDPFCNHLFTAASEGGYPVSAVFNNLDVPLDGNVYPTPILTDFVICLVKSTEYNFLQGQSIPVISSQGTELQRTARMLLNPLPPTPEITSYATPVKTENELGVDGKPDIFAFHYEKSLPQELIASEVNKAPVPVPQTRNSILGTVLARIKRIDDNYELTTSSLGLGKMLPQLDLFSFLTLNQVIDFNKFVPVEIRNSVWDGTLGGVEIFNPLKTPRFGEITEETFITPERQTGIDLSGEQLYTQVPQNLSYYNILISEALNV